MKKLFSVVVATFVALSLVMPFTFAGQALAIVDTKAIDLNIQVFGRTEADATTPEGYKVYRFLSGEPIKMRASFRVSGTDVDLPYASVKLSFPQAGKDLLQDINFVDSRTARQSIRTTDPNTEYSVRYEFEKIAGGDAGAYPLSFTFKNLETPNGERQPLTLQILDEQGNVVSGKEITIVFESQAGSNYKGSKWHYGSEDRLLGRFDTPEARQTATPTEHEATTVTFYNGFTPQPVPGSGSGRGEYVQGTMRVTETIPEGAVLTNHPDNAGWVQDNANPRVYTKEKSAKELTRDRNGNLLMPMVLAFPNQPYKNENQGSYYTDRFVNNSTFEYNDGTGYRNVGQGSATVRFFVSPPPPPPDGVFEISKSSNQGVNKYSGRDNAVLVNVSRNNSDITALWQTRKNDTNSAEKVWPQELGARPAFTWTTEVRSNKRPTKHVTTSTGETRTQDGQTNHTDYLHGLVHYYELVASNEIMPSQQPGMHFKDFVINPAEVDSITGYETESAAVSTAQWINDNIRYDLYLTRVDHWSRGPGADSLAFRQHWDNSAKSAGSTNKLPTESRLVKTGAKIGETINVDDFGGYYNAIAVVFSNPDLHNQRPDGTQVDALPLRNAKLTMTTTSWPIVAGGRSIKHDGTIYVAPADHDYFTTFSNTVLDLLKAGRRSDAQNTLWHFFEHVTASYTSPNGDEVPTASAANGTPAFPIGTHNRRVDGVRDSGGAWGDNGLTIAPNFGRLGLVSSADQTFSYSQDPASMRPVATFNASLSTDTISGADLTRIKNMKGVVLLPAGVFYRRTVDRAGAVADPTIINNYRNTGRQAIVYDFGDYRERSTGTVKYELQITGDAKDASAGDGKNLVDTWVTWDNNDTILAQTGNGNAADEYSMNADGEKSDEILHRQYNITVHQPQEVFISKYVATPSEGTDVTKPENFEWSAYSTLNDIDSELYYQVKISNKFTEPIRKATIADVMPRKDDKKMVANEDNVYAKRGPQQTGSAFATTLSGPIEDTPGNDKANDKFEFSYTTAPIVQENPNFVPEDSWKSAAQISAGATDPQAVREAWKAVTAWRVTLKPGKVIPALPDEFASPEEKAQYKEGDHEVPIFFKASVENNKDIPVDSRAYNSSAAKLDSATKFKEGNEVEVSNVRYIVDGHAFRDFAMNGELGNNRVAGVTAQLVYANNGTDSLGRAYQAGDPVPAEWVDIARRNPATGMLEPSTNPAERGVNTMTTDDAGYYSFIAYKRGDYTVKFTRPERGDYRFIQCGVNEGHDRANAVMPTAAVITDNATVSSTRLSVNPNNLRYNDQAQLLTEEGSLRAIRNVALTDAKQNVIIKKTGLDLNGHETGNLEGTTFKLYARTGDDQGEQIGQAVTTDNTGTATFADIAAGSYYLVEETASAGYRKPARVKMTYTAPQTCGQKGNFTFEKAPDDTENAHELLSYNQDTGVVTVHNKPILGSVQITKKANGDGQYGDPIKDVVFGLYRSGQPVMDNSDSLNPQPLTATTNTDGIATFTNIAGGDYTIKELTPGEGFSTIDTKNTAETTDDINLKVDGIPVSVPADPARTMEENRAHIEAGNKVVTGHIRVVKTNDLNQPLPGATFGLYKKVGTETAPATDAAPYREATTAANGGTEASATPEGEILFTDVPYGTWFIKELRAPQGHTISDKVATVTVRDQGRTYNATPNATFVNIVNKGTIKLKKTDLDTGEPLQGAQFSLFACTGPVDAGTGLHSCAEDAVASQAAYVTDSGVDGIAEFNDVPYGTYVVKETQAPQGYTLSQQTREVTVTENGQTYDLSTEAAGGPWTNERHKGSITLKKVDGEDQRPLQGTTFALYEKTDTGAANTPFSYGQTTFTGQTDAEGTLTFAGVPFGTYVLKETASITGYIMPDDGDPREITLNADNSQIRFIAADTATPKNGWFINTPKMHTLTVTKVAAHDQNLKLKGAVFTLFPARQHDGTWVKDGEAPVGGSETTNTDGVATFNNLRVGHYLLEETEAPAGYTAAQPVHVEADGTNLAIATTVENSIIERDIEFTKVDANDYGKDPKVITPLKGAVFDIYAAELSDGNYVKKGDKLQSATSDTDGKVRFTKLTAGHYVIEETTPATGYQGATDTIHVEVTPGEGIISATPDGYFANNIITGEVRVTKTGETETGTTQPLQGVTFELRKDKNVVATAETGPDGVATFANINYGTYSLVETHTPERFILNTTPVEITIETQGQVIEKDVHNSLKKGNVRVIKRDANAAAKTLAGAIFELKQGQDVKFTSEPTTAEGVATFTQVPYGEYQLVEKTAPEGYVLAITPMTISITADGQDIEKTVDNAPITGTIVVKKLGTVDAKGTQTQPLANVTFELTPVTNEGLTLGEKVTAVSDKAGLVTFRDVPFGTYTVAETKPTAGYQATDKTVKVKVTEQGHTYGYVEGTDTAADFTFTNNIIRNDVRLEKQDAATKAPLAGAKFGLFQCLPKPDNSETETGDPANATATSEATEVTSATAGDTHAATETPANSDICAHTADTIPYQGVTADDGSLVFTDVLYGTYKLRELEAPSGYQLTEAEQTIMVSENKNTDGSNIIVAETVLNTRIRGNVELWKANADNTSMKLSGATFELRPVDADGHELPADARAAYDQDATAGANYQAMSQADGRVSFHNVAAGVYRLVETGAPTGFVLPTQQQLDEQVTQLSGAALITIAENEQTITLGSAEKPVVNEPLKGGIVFHKTGRTCDVAKDYSPQVTADMATGEAASAELAAHCAGLGGAVFVLRPVQNADMPTPFSDVKAYTFTAVSSDDVKSRGVVRFENIPYGTYELVEARAPRGYFRTTRVQRVVVKESGVQVLAPVTNVPYPVPAPSDDEGAGDSPSQPGVPSPEPAAPAPVVPTPVGSVNPKSVKPGVQVANGALAATGAVVDTAVVLGGVMLLLGLLGIYLRRMRGFVS